MRPYMKDKVGYIGFDTMRKIFEGMPIPYAVKLSWRGEPLLHPDILDLVGLIKRERVHEVMLNTNGILLNRELAWGLYLKRLDCLIISVDGGSKETYEKIRKGGDFDLLCQNIVDTYYAFHGKIRIQICEQPANKFELLRWRAKFGAYADSLRIGHLFDPQGKRGYKVTQPNSCTSLWQRIVVGWNGDIHPCPAAFTGEFKLGNIKDTTIQDAWHSDKMNEYRNLLSRHGRGNSPLCKNCTSYC